MRIVNQQTDEDLEFEYQPDSGLIAGPDAGRIRSLIQLAGENVSLPGNWPAISVPSPEKTPRSLALILASFGYLLPEELAQHLPILTDDLPENAIS